MKDDKEFYFDDVFKEFKRLEEIQEIGKSLGKGAFGVVKEVKYKNKIRAGKLVMKETLVEEEAIQDLKGPHIIKMDKICRPIKKFNNNTYHLIIMEKAILRDLGKLNNFFHERNLLKLIFIKCFDEELSDTVLRYYTRQIINGLETLNKNNYVHFDIKPENILITNNLILKLSDFSISKKFDEKDLTEYKIPGGTLGYLTPEYYMNKKLNQENAKKQDYFALGCMIFLLKYGLHFLKTKKDDDHDVMADTIVNLLLRNTNYLYSKKLADEDFIIFTTNLVKIDPKDRYDMEKIYRNKWLNKNLDYLEKVVDNFEMDEEKFLLELQKQDFIIQKNKIFDINKRNNITNKKIESDSNKQNNKNIRKGFRFKKNLYDL